MAAVAAVVDGAAVALAGVTSGLGVSAGVGLEAVTETAVEAAFVANALLAPQAAKRMVPTTTAPAFAAKISRRRRVIVAEHIWTGITDLVIG